ncbi:SDR family oxidoreductase [Derxia gummosa]|uniref:SDR family oxidoreductase n=1 Tax=Derxia gummosa DSM 723 TaxID=1121388 RepID=A0A8B6XCY8_9BURK|nr:SDR family oxidoreductase [Derxia gummosa]
MQTLARKVWLRAPAMSGQSLAAAFARRDERRPDFHLDSAPPVGKRASKRARVAADAAQAALGGLDALVYLAPEPAEGADLVETVVAATVDFTAAARAAAHAMSRGDGGEIVVVCDIAGVCGRQGRAVEASVAGALLGAVRCLAKEFGRQAINVNAVCHASVPEFGVVQPLAPAEQELFGLMKLGRPVGVDQLAQNIVHLVGGRHALTGQLLHAADGLII